MAKNKKVRLTGPDDFSPAFSTPDSAVVLGISFWKLDDLVRQGIVRPTVECEDRGQARWFSFADLVAIRVGLEWSRRGVDWKVVQAAIGYIRNEGLSKIRQRPMIMIDPEKGQVWSATPRAVFPAGRHLLACDLRPGVAAMRKRVEQHVPAPRKRKRRPPVDVTARRQRV